MFVAVLRFSTFGLYLWLYCCLGVLNRSGCLGCILSMPAVWLLKYLEGCIKTKNIFFFMPKVDVVYRSINQLSKDRMETMHLNV